MVQIDSATSSTDYLSVLRAHKWTVVALTILGIALGVGVGYLQDPLYTARAKVLISSAASVTEDTTTTDALDTQTQSEILASEPVAARVIQKLDLDTTPSKLLRDLSANGIPDTRVLELSYTDPSPTRARDIANAFGEEFLDYRREQALNESLDLQQAVNDRIEKASDALTEINQELKADKNNLDLESQKNILTGRLAVLEQRLEDLQANEAIRQSPGQMLETAETPDSPSSPSDITRGAIGAMLGLAAGVVLTLSRDRLNTRFKGREQLEAVLRAPVLATIPKHSLSRKKNQSPLVILRDPGGPASEAYKTLRTNLQFMTSQRSLQSLVITSPGAGEGKSATVANLGAAMALSGQNVILVSADLRRPTLMSYFGRSEEESDKGLSTWLAYKNEPPWASLIDLGLDNLRAIPSGPLPPNPAELLSSARLGQLILALEGICDLVIFDSPPVLSVADASALGTAVGATILVVDATETHRTAAIRAKAELDQVGAELMGTVFNLAPESATPYYYAPARPPRLPASDADSSGNGLGARRGASVEPGE
jgi:polysaccharide biosynthesis transport protein